MPQISLKSAFQGAVKGASSHFGIERVAIISNVLAAPNLDFSQTKWRAQQVFKILVCVVCTEESFVLLKPQSSTAIGKDHDQA